MKNPTYKSILAVAFTMLTAIVLIRTFAMTPTDPSAQKEEEREEATQVHSRVVTENGRAVIKLSPETQERLGVKAVPLEAAREQKEVTAPGVVLDVQGLVSLTTSYASAQANLRKAENNLSVSQSEYDRLKALYAKQQNVSQKDFQTGEGLFHNAQTDVRMARQNLALATAALRQSWGNRIAEWVTDDLPSLNRILNREDMLVQVTLSADGPATAPSAVSLELPNQRSVTARLVSRFPQVDPRIQGTSFLYMAHAQGMLAPGLSVVAHVPYGPRLAGVVIPSSAVVWLNGEQWVYIKIAPDEFTRRAVAAGLPVAGGLFVSKGFAPGDRIVTAGAQMLLSEESRSQSGGEKEEGDED